MNILHIIDSAGMYGAEAVLLNLMEAQVKMGLCPFLLSMGNRGASKKDIEIEAENRGLTVLTLRFRDGLNLNCAFEILNTATRMDMQIIHSHGYKGNILLGILPHRLRNIPIITTIHGWTATRIASKMKLYELFDAIAMKNLDAVVAVSKSISSKQMIKCLRVKPIVINNGLKVLAFDNGAFAREFPIIASKCSNTFKVLSIGRLSPEKGFDTLINAMSLLASKGIPISLVIVGEGACRQNLTSMIKNHGLGNAIHLLGYHRSAHKYLPDFDAFVLPSLTEGLPVTILEAMQAEVPIIATRVGEVPALLDDGELGVLVRPNDRMDLSLGIMRVFLDRVMAKDKARKAKMKALSNYGVEQMATKYGILYDEMVDKSK